MPFDSGSTDPSNRPLGKLREALSVGFALDNNEDEANRLTLQAISRYLQRPRLAELAKVNREVNMELGAFLYRHDGLYNRAGNRMR